MSEATVKLLKSHFYRTLGDATFTFEELKTALARVETILSSRPLTSLFQFVHTNARTLPRLGDSPSTMPERDEATPSLNRLLRRRRVSRYRGICGRVTIVTLSQPITGTKKIVEFKRPKTSAKRGNFRSVTLSLFQFEW